MNLIMFNYFHLFLANSMNFNAEFQTLTRVNSIQGSICNAPGKAKYKMAEVIQLLGMLTLG